MTFNVRKTSAFAVFLAVLFASTLAFALKVPPPPEYNKRRDPNTPGGERVGADETFEGYPADPDEIEGQLYTDTLADYHKYSPHWTGAAWGFGIQGGAGWMRSEEHTSELQSRGHLVCRLLLEKNKRIDCVG